MTTEAIPLVVRRLIPAPPERIFDAFRLSERLSQWFTPGPEVAVDVLEYRFVPEGSFRLRYTLPDGRHPVVGGVFETINRPSRIAFSWVWEAPDPLEGVPMHVSFTLRAKRLTTEVTVTHRGIPSNTACTIHEQSWNGTLAVLSQFIQRSISDEEPCDTDIPDA